MEIVDAPTVRLLPRIADGAAAVEVLVPPGGKPDADDADALHWRYQLDCMMEAVDTAGATPGGRAASWFPVAWTASEAHAVPVRLTADYGRTVRFRVRALPGGHYGDNTWEERGVLTGYDDDGGSPGGDALGKPRRQLDLDEIRAESRRLVAGLKSVYDGKSAETFSPPSRTLALPVLIEPELLSAGRAGPRLIAGQVRMRPPLGATVASFQCEVGRPSAARGDSREWSVHDCTVPAAEVAALRGGSATIRFESTIGAKLLGGAIVVRVRARGFADAVSLATPWSGTSERSRCRCHDSSRRRRFTPSSRRRRPFHRICARRRRRGGGGRVGRAGRRCGVGGARDGGGRVGYGPRRLGYHLEARTDGADGIGKWHRVTLANPSATRTS